MISVDELRAAGALDVPPAWRKSLRVERDLPLFPEDDMLPAEQEPPSCDPDDDGPADDVR